MRLPARRVLAIDVGARTVKLLLMHSDFGRVRVLRHEMVDLRSEGLVSADEIKAHLHSVIGELRHPPIALILPEHLSASHVIDLPPGPESEVGKQIGDEAIKLSGVSDSRIIYDFARLEAGVSERQQFWVTLCQEDNVRGQIFQLGVDQEDICEVTTPANALITAHRMASPSASHAVLLHLGAQTTVLAGVHAGQGAFAASIQMGGDFFTRTLARAKAISEEDAEALKRSQDLFRGPDACRELIEAVDGWIDEVRRQLADASKQHVPFARDPKTPEIIWSGGGFEQPGFLEYLASKGLRVRPWPEDTVVDGVSCPHGFEIAFGAALQALGYSSQPVSLLPADYRTGWQKRIGRQRLEFASIALVILCALALGLGTWRKISLIRAKESLRTKIQTSQEAVDSNEALTWELLSEYSGLRPVFARQQHTKDTLKTLALLQQSRTNLNFWYLVLADQQTYFSLPSLDSTASSNRAAMASISADWIEPARLATITNRGWEWRLPDHLKTNSVSPAKPGYIAELCIPGDSETVRRNLQELVTLLKQNPLFSKADLLSEELRRNLADPNLLVPDKHYVLALDFARSEFQQPLPPRSKPDAKSRAGRRTRSQSSSNGGEAIE